MAGIYTSEKNNKGKGSSDRLTGSDYLMDSTTKGLTSVSNARGSGGQLAVDDYLMDSTAKDLTSVSNGVANQRNGR